jgi:DNA-binding beta-propeller fold protein YncE
VVRIPSTCGLALGLAALACASPTSEGESEQASETESADTEVSESETGLPTETETETGDTDGDPLRPHRLAVTADWRAKRLSLLDYAALRDGAATRSAALWKTIELPDHEPGPLEVELTPDGKLAVVAISPGFFAGSGGALVGAGEVPIGGGLLIVDLDTDVIVAELATAQYPMGIAISPDGSTAWTANYGGNGQSGTTLSVIDLQRFAIIEELEVGPGPEQLDLSADGSLGIINTAGDGSIRLFETQNPSASLSAPLVVSSDPSWVLVLDDGMDRAVAINSLGPPGYSLLDIGDPSAPVVLDTVAVSGVAYAAAPGRSADEILLSVFAGVSISLQMFNVDTAEIVAQIDVPVAGFPLGIVFEPADQIALVPVPGANALIVADFASLEHRVLDWQSEVGPTYITLE